MTPAAPMSLELGQAVTFTSVLINHHEPAGTAKWISHECDPRQGFFMGFRTVYDGVRSRGSYDDPGYLKVTRGIYHALVVVHPRKAPLRVPLDAIRAGCAQG
jgi:hypothetical protein